MVRVFVYRFVYRRLYDGCFCGLKIDLCVFLYLQIVVIVAYMG